MCGHTPSPHLPFLAESEMRVGWQNSQFMSRTMLLIIGVVKLLFSARHVSCMWRFLRLSLASERMLPMRRSERGWPRPELLNIVLPCHQVTLGCGRPAAKKKPELLSAPSSAVEAGQQERERGREREREVCHYGRLCLRVCATDMFVIRLRLELASHSHASLIPPAHSLPQALSHSTLFPLSLFPSPLCCSLSCISASCSQRFSCCL